MIFIGKCVNKISIKNPSACVKQTTYIDVMLLLVHPKNKNGHSTVTKQTKSHVYRAYCNAT